MVFNYAFVEYVTFESQMINASQVEDKRKYKSYWNYFNSGKDGLKWDCIQIIGMAEKKPLLKNDSPTWTCLINGYEVERDSIDRSYIRMIEHWLENPRWNYDNLLTIHKKVVEFG